LNKDTHFKVLELYERYSSRHPSCHHLRSEQFEVEGMDMPEVEGMDTVDTGMGEDRVAELEMVERALEGMVLARHWTDDGAARHC
jgi:hypothetical protein